MAGRLVLQFLIGCLALVVAFSVTVLVLSLKDWTMKRLGLLPPPRRTLYLGRARKYLKGSR